MSPLLRAFAFAMALLAAVPCRAEPSEAVHQSERALMERDRQAAEFSRPELRDMPRRGEGEPLRPDERVLRAREREAYLLNIAPPAAAAPSPQPLPLPGGPRHGIDPVPVQGSRG